MTGDYRVFWQREPVGYQPLPLGDESGRVVHYPSLWGAAHRACSLVACWGAALAWVVDEGGRTVESYGREESRIVRLELAA